MSEQHQDDDDIRKLLQDVFPRVETGLQRDLWPALSHRVAARTQRITWYDWVLTAAAIATIAAFPDVALVLLYYL